MNALGLYFRFVNEVVIRRTFLDRRACVESTLKLNYEKEQEVCGLNFFFNFFKIIFCY